MERPAVPPLKPLGHRLLASGAWVTAGRIGTQVAGFVINVLIVRLLVPEAVGGYFLIVSLVTVAVSVSQAGLQSGIVRLVANATALGEPDQAARIVAGSIRLIAGCGAVVAGLLAFAGPWLADSWLGAPAAAGSMRLAALWMLALSLGSVIAEGFRGYHQYAAAALFGGMFTNAMVLVFCLVATKVKGTIMLGDVLAMLAFASLINLALSWRRIAVLHGVKAHLRGTSARQLLRTGLPLMVTSVALVFIGQADLWIVGLSGTQADVALYGSAMRLGQLVYMPLLISNALLLPFIAELFAQNRAAELERMTRGMASLALIPAVFAFCVILFMGDSVLSAVYGAFYAPAASALALLTAGQLVNMWAGSAIVTLMMTGHEREVMYITIGFGCLLLVAAAVAMPLAGVNGVAAASGAVAAASGVFSLYRVKRLVGIRTSANIRHLTGAWREIVARLAGQRT
ncbi:MAG: lipopolysaccharide biosynthesis protein [Burkholderiales bacterium]